MKEAKYSFLAFLCLLLLFTSCTQFQNFVIPQKVQVKTTAEYNFTVADLEKDFSDMITVDSLKEKIGSGFKFELYDYNPGSNQTTQSYLLRLPIQEVPLDFAKYMESIDIGKGLEAMSFEQSFEIPNLEIKAEKEVDLDILNDMMIALLRVHGQTGEGPQQAEFKGFGTATISNGKLRIWTNARGGVKLYSQEDLEGTSDFSSVTPIASGSIGNNGVVYFDLSGKTIYAEHTYIDFVDNSAGENFEVFLTPSSKFLKVTGLTQDAQTITIDPIVFEGQGEASPVKECTFDTGSNLTLSVVTEGWENITINKNVKLTGGLTVDFTGIGDSITKQIAGEQYTNSDITLTPELTLSFGNTTIDFSKKPKFVLSSDIKGFSSVTVKLPEGIQTNIEEEQALPNSATSAIENVVWNSGSGIEVKYTNTLPTGNNMRMTASSSFIGLSNTSHDIESTGADEVKTLSFLSSGDGHEQTIDSTTKVDFTATLTLPGFKQDANTITVQNVEPGKTYKVAMQIEPKFNWKSVTVDLSALGGSNNVSGKYALDFNPKQILKKVDETLKGQTVSDKIDLSHLYLKLFCEKPDLSSLGDLSLSGKIAFGPTTGDGSSIPNADYLLGSASEDAVFNFYSEPKLIVNNKGTVISDLSNINCIGKDLATTINNMADAHKLGLNYNFSLSGAKSGEITIFQSDLQNSKNTSLKITAMIILPLELKITQDCDIDVLKIVGKEYKDGEPDLLGRTNLDNTDSSVNDLLDIIDYVKIVYEPSKKPLIANANLVVDLDGDASNFTQQTINLNGGSYTESPSKVVNNFIRPSVRLQLNGNQTVCLPREMKFKTRLDLKIKTNGKPLEFGGE